MFVNNAIGGAGGDVVGAVRMGFDPGYRRPYLCPETGRLVVNVHKGDTELVKGERVPVRTPSFVADEVNNGNMVAGYVTNATALRKEEWNLYDTVILRAARYRLMAWSDLARSNTYGGFNGMAKTSLEHETMSDPGEAIVDMNGISEGRSDAPVYQLQGLPLPITHSDFYIDLRKLTASRNSGTPIDTVMGEASGRRIAESVEKTTIGIQTGLTYNAITQTGGYGRTASVYGYTNFSARQTRSLAGRAPSNASWTASQTLADVLACLDQLKAAKMFGPFMIYHSNDWDKYMDNDYILTGGNVATQTLRNRLRAIEGVMDVKRLDFLFASQPETNTQNSAYKGPGGESLAQTYPFTLIFVQLGDPNVARAVNGMDVTTVQWETKGGMMLNFKVMCIQVPQIRADHYGNCGILHATFT